MLFWVLISVAAVIAPTISLPTRTEPVEENDYRAALYRDANRRQMDSLALIWIPARDGVFSYLDKNEARRQTTTEALGGGHLLRREVEQLGGGHLLRRQIEQLGGGHLLKGFVDQFGRVHILGGAFAPPNAHLLRNIETLRLLGMYPRQNRAGQTLDSLSGVSFGTNKRLDTLSGIGFGSQKRNFDEIDRSGFNGFVKKNFDEIDRSGFNSFVKKNFDEIDRSGFNSFVKRSVDSQDSSTH